RPAGRRRPRAALRPCRARARRRRRRAAPGDSGALGFARPRLARLRDHVSAPLSDRQIRARPRPGVPAHHRRRRRRRDAAAGRMSAREHVMTDPGRPDAAQTFESQRRSLTGLAYRMLGSLAEAEDVVQEAFLRWHAADRAAVADPRAYLSRVVTRLCLDQMKSARSRRETYVCPWLPEPHDVPYWC